MNTNKQEVNALTNINCSSPCVYQKEGKCLLENVSPCKMTPSQNCAYFVEAKKKKNDFLLFLLLTFLVRRDIVVS